MRAALLVALLALSGCSLGFLPDDEPGDDTGEPEPPAARFRIFATSEAYDATFALRGGGDPLDVADQDCREAASAAGMVGRFQAWLSTPFIYAIDRIPDVRGAWATISGDVVFPSRVDMVSLPRNPIREDQFGNVLTGDAYAWTGTAVGGVTSRTDCNGWTQTVGYGTVGAVWMDDRQWTDAGLAECSRLAHLICVEY